MPTKSDVGVGGADEIIRKYVFADEAGNFDFSAGEGASKYFMLGTVVVDDVSIGDRLADLRRDFAWNGIILENGFHASEDAQVVRDAVYGILSTARFRYDVTILEKRKAMPHIRPTTDRFYKYAWFYHFKKVCPEIATSEDELLVVSASLGTKKRGIVIREAIRDVMAQVSVCKTYKIASWQANTDPCLQVVDYCTWAMQRKWERQDDRSYRLIKDKVTTEFDMFRPGTKHYY